MTRDRPRRLLLASFIQETSSFNPVPTRRDDFQVVGGEQMRRVLTGTNMEVAGALEVVDDAGDEAVCALAAWAGSGGPVHEGELTALLDEFEAAVRDAVASGGVDGVALLLHGAMQGQTEIDPEGALVERVRRHVGDEIPLVISMDLHGVLTDRMLAGAQAVLPFHTYPHTDQADTGARAARALLRLVDGARSHIERLRLPLLVRGDELLTATGLFGEAIRRCQALEAEPFGLCAGVLIGNPFTDVPDLRSNIVLTVDASQVGAVEHARCEALALARYMWSHRQRLQAPLTALPDAIRQAREGGGLTVFSDAADATSSGASGDSNHILKGLVDDAFPKRALLTIVDAPAVDGAVRAGIGQRLHLTLGGQLDPHRHPPLAVDAYVKSLSDGEFLYENGTAAHAGPTAVLVLGEAIHVLVTTRRINVMGRRLFSSHGLEPAEFDLVSMKSPNGFRTHYEAIAARIVPVDVPGSTSANLHSLPYENCPRPIWPLDDEADVIASLDFPLED
jgi:microcystin degradation protein MlrC